MTGPLVVGYDGSDQANDALALGRLLAGRLGAGLVAACVYPPAIHFAYTGVDVVERELREAAERQLEGAAGDGGRVRRGLACASSAARGLLKLAEDERARMLVVGASHRGSLGEALLGTVGRSVLHGAPCPVAVAPRGFARAEPGDPRVVGVGFDGSPESERALAEAIALAQAFEARLRLVAVVHSAELFPEPAWIGSPNARLANAIRERHQRELDRGVAMVPDALFASGVVAVGEPEQVLRREAELGIDLLVVGSRGYGPLRRVLLGSVASRLLHAAPCPVVVCPRGAELEPAGGQPGGQQARGDC